MPDARSVDPTKTEEVRTPADAQPPSEETTASTTAIYLRPVPKPAPPQPSAAVASRPAAPATKSVSVPQPATAIPGSVPSVVTEDVVPPTIEPATPPGKEVPMQVVVAAEVLRRVKRTRQAVSLVSQVVIRAYEEEALHAEVCRHLVGYGGYLMVWIGLAEDDPERVIRPVAHDGLEANFLSALRITWANDLSNSTPTSLAIQEQRPHVARNILKEPRYAVLRKEAQLYGYTATCALPLQFAQYGMGVLTIHAMEPDAFNAEEVSLLRELANDVSAGVISLRERGARRVLEKQLAAVVDAAQDAIIGSDLAGRVTEWNAGATRMFGHARNEAIGRNVTDLIIPPEGIPEETRRRAVVAQGDRPARFDAVRRCKEGKLLTTSVTMSPIVGGDGKVIGMTAVEHDNTEARLLESAMRARHLEETEARRLKDVETARKTFLSEASHELKTPLTPLLIHVEAMRESPDGTVEQNQQHLAVIHRNVLRLNDLINDMLESSRLETGRFKLDLAPFAIANALQDAVKGLAEPAEAKGLTLDLGNLPMEEVSADRHRVDQVLYNLLGNAISFTSTGGRITLSGELQGTDVVVRVRDTGLGMTADQIGLLFQPFSRPHEGTGSAPKGTGLGLFISKGIVEQHGGRIWAESEGPAKGSTFCFSLPTGGPKPAAVGAGAAA